jgi:hypothetical protein
VVKEIQMVQIKSFQKLVAAALFVAALAPLSMFADDRPDWRTDERSDRYSDRRGDIEGTIVSVARDGDDFYLRTRRGTVFVDARGGIHAYYRGERYRIRDLDPGDYVRVDVASNSGNRLRARAVYVLDTGGRNGGNWDRDNDRDYDRRYDTLSGRVISFDARRDLLLVRTSRGDVRVATRELERRYGRNWSRSITVGEYVTFGGRFDGRTFVATSFDERNNRRW